MSLVVTNPIDHFFKNHSVTAAVVTYSGSGDSGCMDELDLSFAPETSEQDRAIAWRELKKPNPTLDDRSLYDTLKDAADEAIEQLHSGYEINEGGSGSITFTADGKAIVDHYTHYESITTEEPVTSDLVDYSSVTGLREVIEFCVEKKAPNIRIAYSGSSDEGSVHEIMVGDINAFTPGAIEGKQGVFCLFADDLVYRLDPDFEDDYGGGGIILIDLHNRKLTHTKNYYGERSEQEVTVLGAEFKEVDGSLRLELLQPVLSKPERPRLTQG